MTLKTAFTLPARLLRLIAALVLAMSFAPLASFAQEAPPVEGEEKEGRVHTSSCCPMKKRRNA